MASALVGTCRLLFRFESENEGELELQEGDAVEVIEEQVDGWCVAEFKGTIGLVPSSYLQKIPDAPVETAPEENGRPQKRAPAPPIDASAVAASTAPNGEAKSPKSPKMKESKDKDKDKKKKKSLKDKSRKKDAQAPASPSSPAPTSPRSKKPDTPEPSSPEPARQPKPEVSEPSEVKERPSSPAPIEAQPRPLPAVPRRTLSVGIPKLPPKPTTAQRPEGRPPPVPPKTLRPPTPDQSPTPNAPPSPTTQHSDAVGFTRSGSTDALNRHRRSTSKPGSLRKDPFGTGIDPPQPKEEVRPEPTGPFVPDPERDQQRLFIVKELVQTEKTYVAGLKEAIEKFYRPLLAVAQQGIEPTAKADDIKLIFSNLEHFLPLNQNLLNKLEERLKAWEPTSCIGDIFVKFTPFLKIYSTYSNQYDTSLDVLEKIAKHQWFITVCEKKSNVENLIITPIQRIPRYSLLLSDLLRKTPKEHPDHFDIEKALTLTKDVAEHVNRSINTYKNVAKLTDAGLSHLLAPHRYLIREGPLTITSPDSPVKERKTKMGIGLLGGTSDSKQKKHVGHFLLFNDMLVFIDEALDENLLPKKARMTLGKGTKKKDKGYQWPLELIWLKDVGLKTGFELLGPGKMLSCYFETAEAREEWWNALIIHIRNAIMSQPEHDGLEFEDDAAASMEKRFGKYVFNNGDTYEGWWGNGKINGEGRMECFGTTYEGTFENGYRTGTGSITYVGGQTYKGSWKGGRPSGSGTLSWPNSDKYEGEFKDGKKYGKGTMTYHNGDVYDGEWKLDVASGTGTLKLVKGLEYTGSWQDGRFSGNGSLKLSGGGKYDGAFVNGQRYGKGVMIYPDKSKYDGDWQSDQRHGAGRFEAADGVVYEGEWLKDSREGKGVCKYPNGDVYDGTWAGDRAHGTGVWTSEKGYIRRYEGDWNHGRRHGKGTITFASGDKYAGELADNLVHGNGKYTYANGSTVEGKWLHGIKDNKTTILSSKTSTTLAIDLGDDSVNVHLEPPTLPSFDITLTL